MILTIAQQQTDGRGTFQTSENTILSEYRFFLIQKFIKCKGVARKLRKEKLESWSRSSCATERTHNQSSGTSFKAQYGA